MACVIAKKYKICYKDVKLGSYVVEELMQLSQNMFSNVHLDLAALEPIVAKLELVAVGFSAQGITRVLHSEYVLRSAETIGLTEAVLPRSLYSDTGLWRLTDSAINGWRLAVLDGDSESQFMLIPAFRECSVLEEKLRALGGRLPYLMLQMEQNLGEDTGNRDLRALHSTAINLLQSLLPEGV